MHKIRLANANDAVEILQIYAPFITSSSITFEYEVPRPFEMRRRIINTLTKFPYIVCEIDGRIAGYAYASLPFARAAYQWEAELSVYIREEYQRCNIASALYYSLIEILKLQGYYTAIARITIPNEKSEHFHTAFGFKKVGVLTNSGFKHGSWHSVALYEKPLFDTYSEPLPTKPIKDIDGEKLSKIFSVSEKIIKVKQQN